MSDVAERPVAAPAPEDGGPDPLLYERKLHSIVPRETVSGKALTFVIAIMAFLASLTLGAVTLVNDTARGWQNDIAREVTIQVRPLDGVDMESALIRVRQIAGSFDGVASVDVLDEEKTSALLEPWLGTGLDLNELPVPRLVALTISDGARVDFIGLKAQLAQDVPSASLDDHRTWVSRLTVMARATVVIGVVILSLVITATVLIVIFATRGAMAGSRHIIEVLHFVGAEQSYIASQFQTHFLLLGLKGAVAGGLAAILLFLVTGWWTSSNIADPASDQVAALFGTFAVGPAGYIGTLLLIFVLALLAAITSRLTVFRYVGTLDRSAADE